MPLRDVLSKVETMKTVATFVRCHHKSLVVLSQARQVIGFIESLDGLFPAAERRVQGFNPRMSPINTVIFSIAGKRGCSAVDLPVQQPT